MKNFFSDFDATGFYRDVERCEFDQMKLNADEAAVYWPNISAMTVYSVANKIAFEDYIARKSTNYVIRY